MLGAAGGVGMAAIDIGKALGATVVACASTSAKLAAAETQVGACGCVPDSRPTAKCYGQGTRLEAQPYPTAAGSAGRESQLGAWEGICGGPRRYLRGPPCTFHT